MERKRSTRIAVAAAAAIVCLAALFIIDDDGEPAPKKNKWNYDHITLNYSVHACSRLHNWLMHARHLNYDPTADPKYLFTAAW